MLYPFNFICVFSIICLGRATISLSFLSLDLDFFHFLDVGFTKKMLEYSDQIAEKLDLI